MAAKCLCPRCRQASSHTKRYWPASVMLAGWQFSCGIFSFVLVPGALLSLCCIGVLVRAEKNVCLVNEKFGYSDPANVYECKPPLKCCVEFTKPSCCGSKPSWQIIQEQITLWGGLFAILLAIASIVYCRKNDLNVPACIALKHGVTRICCGSSGDAEDHEQVALKVTSEHRRTDEDDKRHGWRNNSVNPMPDYTHIEMSHV